MDPQEPLNQTNIDKIENDFVNRDKIEGSQINAARDVFIYPRSSVDLKPVVPNMLPRRTTRYFTGRLDDLQWIKQNLAPSRTLVISGPGGMGKTTLSIEAVNQMAVEDGNLYDLFPDGVIFYTFYGQPSIDIAYSSLVTAYGYKAEGNLEQLTRQVLSRKRPLIILDGCEDLSEQDGLRGVIEALGQSGVLITTRNKKHCQLADSFLELDRLPRKEAFALLATLSKENKFNPEIGYKICSYVDYLPLGIDIAGNYLGEQAERPPEYLLWLEQKPLAALDQGVTRRESMYRMISKSVNRLDDLGKELLLALGQFSYLPLPIWILEELFKCEYENLKMQLGKMARYGLVHLDMGTVHCAHALVHGYARGIHRTKSNDGWSMLKNICQWLIINMESWQNATPPDFEKCDALRSHAMNMLEQLEKYRALRAVNKLVNVLEGYLDLQGHFSESILTLKAAARVCKRFGDRRNENVHLVKLASVFLNTGQIEQSIQYYQRALNYYHQVKDKKNAGAVLAELGNAYSKLGQSSKSIRYYQYALQIAKNENNRLDESRQLGNLGNMHRSRGDMQPAMDYFDRGLKISHEIRDLEGEALQLNNLGLAFHSLGQVAKAIDYLTEALRIARLIGDRRIQGAILGSLGKSFLSLDRVIEAIGYFKSSLEIAQQIGDRRGEGVQLGNIGVAYIDLGQVDDAIRYFKNALEISRQIGNLRGAGNQLGNLGVANHNLGWVQEAVGYYQQSLEISRQTGDRQGEVRQLGNLGNAFSDLGQHKKAIEYFFLALNISCQVGDRRSESNQLGNLGNVCSNLGRTDESVKFYQRAFEISHQIGDRKGEGTHLGNLGNIYRILGKIDKAINFFRQALIIQKEIGDLNGSGIHLANLGLLVKEGHNDPQKTKVIWQKALAIFEQTGHQYADDIRERLINLEN